MSENKAKPVIDLQEVMFAFNHHLVLRDICFQVKEGDFLALIGPNGGGKTTLLKLMLGLLKPKSGSVRIFGESPEKVSHRIGYVPQDIQINREFPISVRDVVRMGQLSYARKRLRPMRLGRTDVAEHLERMGMSAYWNRRIGDLSGGQRQRVFIARALAVEPDILFLDEPTANIDSPGQTEFYNLLRKLNESMTIVMASHDLMLLSSYVKSVACVNQTVHYHDEAEVTPDMMSMYHCPVELIAHGVPHRVLQKH